MLNKRWQLDQKTRLRSISMYATPRVVQSRTNVILFHQQLAGQPPRRKIAHKEFLEGSQEGWPVQWCGDSAKREEDARCPSSQARLDTRRWREEHWLFRPERRPLHGLNQEGGEEEGIGNSKKLRGLLMVSTRGNIREAVSASAQKRHASK